MSELHALGKQTEYQTDYADEGNDSEGPSGVPGTGRTSEHLPLVCGKKPSNRR